MSVHSIIQITGGGVLVCFSPYDFRLRQAAMPVTHSSKMTHLSSSLPTQALFHNTAIFIKPSFTGSDEWRAFSGDGEGQYSLMRRTENSIDLYTEHPLSMNSFIMTVKCHRNSSFSAALELNSLFDMLVSFLVVVVLMTWGGMS